MRLLIVDDNRAMRAFIRDLLVSPATKVDECENGMQALNTYRSTLPDFVLMDVEMGELDGISATRQIVSDYPFAKIIILTNFDDPDLREAARAAGACAYVMKDRMFEIRQLLGDLCSKIPPV